MYKIFISLLYSFLLSSVITAFSIFVNSSEYIIFLFLIIFGLFFSFIQKLKNITILLKQQELLKLYFNQTVKNFFIIFYFKLKIINILNFFFIIINLFLNFQQLVNKFFMLNKLKIIILILFFFSYLKIYNYLYYYIKDSLYFLWLNNLLLTQILNY